MRYINITKEISKLSPFRKYKIGCILVYKKQIIATGYNSYKTHPLQKVYDIERYSEECINAHSLHAEMQALLQIRKLPLDKSKITCYTVRVNRRGEYRNSRPCKSCIKALMDFGIRRLIYSTDDGIAEETLI